MGEIWYLILIRDFTCWQFYKIFMIFLFFNQGRVSTHSPPQRNLCVCMWSEPTEPMFFDCIVWCFSREDQIERLQCCTVNRIIATLYFGRKRKRESNSIKCLHTRSPNGRLISYCNQVCARRSEIPVENMAWWGSCMKETRGWTHWNGLKAVTGASSVTSSFNTKLLRCKTEDHERVCMWEKEIEILEKESVVVCCFLTVCYPSSWCIAARMYTQHRDVKFWRL